MALEGIHHVTAITADAQANVDFYARVLGLRLVKKTVNFDAPDIYHLYFGDERGTPGSILTFFEFPGAAPGRAGEGMVHRVHWRVGREEALAFWAAAPRRRGVATERAEDGSLHRPEGLATSSSSSPATTRRWPPHADDIPAEYALLGFHGVRAYASRPDASSAAARGDRLRARRRRRLALRGDERHAVLRYDAPPAAARRHERRHGPPRRVVGRRRRRARGLRAQAVQAGARATRDHRPPVLPLRLLPRAERRALRARQPRHRLRRTTSRWSRSARRCSCRRSTRRAASSSSRR